MADDHRHPSDALQDAVDGRLDAAGQAALDSHVAECDRCRRELKALLLVKAQLAAGRSAADVPHDLDARLRHALDVEDRSTSAGRVVRLARRTPTWWLAAAAMLIAVVGIWVGTRSRSPALVEQVAADVRAFASGTLALPLETADASALEAHLHQSALGFRARVFDFSMMNYRLTGGGVHHVAGLASALFAYRGPNDQAVVCQMYEGRTTALPSPIERRHHNGIEFLIHRRGEITLVFWQEGPLVCVLAANENPEATIQLAFAKAMKA